MNESEGKRVSEKGIQKYIEQCTRYLENPKAVASPGILPIYNQKNPLSEQTLGSIFTEFSKNELYQYGRDINYGNIKHANTQKNIGLSYIFAEDDKLIYFSEKGGNVVFAVDKRIYAAEIISSLNQMYISVFS